jgi:hypothetical protein
MPKSPKNTENVTKLTEAYLLKAGFLKINNSWHHPSNLPHHDTQSTATESTESTASPNLPAGIPDPVAQRPSRQTLVVLENGKEQSKASIICRITRYAPSLLDADNFAGGCKGLIDELRYAKLIPDDNPAAIELQFVQRHAPRGHQGMMVEIIVD